MAAPTANATMPPDEHRARREQPALDDAALPERLFVVGAFHVVEVVVDEVRAGVDGDRPEQGEHEQQRVELVLRGDGRADEHGDDRSRERDGAEGGEPGAERCSCAQIVGSGSASGNARSCAAANSGRCHQNITRRDRCAPDAPRSERAYTVRECRGVGAPSPDLTIHSTRPPCARFGHASGPSRSSARRRDMAVRTWVGRFCVADGHVDEEGPWLGSLIRQRPDEEADELYVLVEPASPGSVEFTSQLVEVIAQLYHKDALSLTGALTRSLRAAHEHLREWNRRSLPEHQVGAGATCLALRGADAYLAQVGPSLAYVRSASGDVRRIQADDADFEHALGVARGVSSRSSRASRWSRATCVLAASTQLDEIAPREHIERILARGSDEALPELYLLCRDRPNMALVLLSCFEEEAEQPPDFLTRDGDGAGSAVRDRRRRAALRGERRARRSARRRRARARGGVARRRRRWTTGRCRSGRSTSRCARSRRRRRRRRRRACACAATARRRATSARPARSSCRSSRCRSWRCSPCSRSRSSGCWRTSTSRVR